MKKSVTQWITILLIWTKRLQVIDIAEEKNIYGTKCLERVPITSEVFKSNLYPKKLSFELEKSVKDML